MIAIAARSSNSLVSNLVLSLCHLKLIIHGEDAGHGIGPDIGDVFVAFIVHHPHESYMPVLHDDVDGLDYSQVVALKRGVSVNCAEHRQAQTVIVRRDW